VVQADHVFVAMAPHFGICHGRRNVVFPAAWGTVSFGPNQAYALGPIYIAHYDTGTKQLENSAQPVSK